MKSMLLLGAAALVAAQVGTARAEPLELKLALWGPPQAYLNAEILVPWAKEVEKASGGALRIRVFQNTLGNPRTVHGNVVNGVADLGWVIQPSAASSCAPASSSCLINSTAARSVRSRSGACMPVG